MTKEFVITRKEIVYTGFFRMEKYHIRHTLFGGGWSGEFSRELFLRGSCVAVLLYDPVTDEIVLIEQFRVGALINPERAWMLEIVAGAIEEGESAEDVAHREAFEEAGCQVQDMFIINEFYTTPGSSSERITLFCGRVDSTGIGGIHGLIEEDENIRVSTIGVSEAYAMVEGGLIESAIPIIAIQWLMLNKQTLKERWLGMTATVEPG
jgi:ADP-ribose pyrophosphatase